MTKPEPKPEPLELRPIVGLAAQLLAAHRPELKRGRWSEADPPIRHHMREISWALLATATPEEARAQLEAMIQALAAPVPTWAWIVPVLTPPYRGIQSCWCEAGTVGLRGTLYEPEGLGGVLLRLDFMTTS